MQRAPSCILSDIMLRKGPFDPAKKLVEGGLMPRPCSVVLRGFSKLEGIDQAGKVPRLPLPALPLVHVAWPDAKLFPGEGEALHMLLGRQHAIKVQLLHLLHGTEHRPALPAEVIGRLSRLVEQAHEMLVGKIADETNDELPALIGTEACVDTMFPSDAGRYDLEQR